MGQTAGLRSWWTRRLWRNSMASTSRTRAPSLTDASPRSRRLRRCAPTFWTQQHHTQVHDARLSLHRRDNPCGPTDAILGSAHCWEIFQDPRLLCTLCCWDSRTTCCSHASDLADEVPELGQLCRRWGRLMACAASGKLRSPWLPAWQSASAYWRTRQTQWRLHGRSRCAEACVPKSRLHVLSVSHRTAGVYAGS